MQIDPVDSKNNDYIIVGLQTKSFINKLLDFFWTFKKSMGITNKTYLFEVLQ